MTIKIGDRVRVRSTYYRDAYHGQEGVIYLRNNRDFYYFKSEEVVLSFPVGTSFGFEAVHLEVIPQEPKTLAEYTDQELADEWQKLSPRAREMRRELQARGFKLQANVIANNNEIWNNMMDAAAEKWRYRFFKSVTTVEETVL